jgi:hypothetical protein
VGVISIGNLVNAIIIEQAETIGHLSTYISGRKDSMSAPDGFLAGGNWGRRLELPARSYRPFRAINSFPASDFSRDMPFHKMDDLAAVRALGRVVKASMCRLPIS